MNVFKGKITNKNGLNVIKKKNLYCNTRLEGLPERCSRINRRRRRRKLHSMQTADTRVKTNKNNNNHRSVVAHTHTEKNVTPRSTRQYSSDAVQPATLASSGAPIYSILCIMRGVMREEVMSCTQVSHDHKSADLDSLSGIAVPPTYAHKSVKPN